MAIGDFLINNKQILEEQKKRKVINGELKYYSEKVLSREITIKEYSILIEQLENQFGIVSDGCRFYYRSKFRLNEEKDDIEFNLVELDLKKIDYPFVCPIESICFTYFRVAILGLKNDKTKKSSFEQDIPFSNLGENRFVQILFKQEMKEVIRSLPDGINSLIDIFNKLNASKEPYKTYLELKTKHLVCERQEEKLWHIISEYVACSRSIYRYCINKKPSGEKTKKIIPFKPRDYKSS